MNYATLTQVRAYLGLAAAETGEDALLTRFIKSADGYINGIRRGDVRYETRLYDYPLRRYEALGAYDADTFVTQMNVMVDLGRGRLRLDDDLLYLVSVANGDGTAVALTDLVQEPPNLYPKGALRLKSGKGLAWLPGSDGTYEQVISVTGWWGYHPDYGTAWVDSLDTVKNSSGITAAATSITVSDADGAAADLDSPRFQAGQLLKLESEFLDLLAVNTSTNVLTVKRGVNGTTAAAHAKETSIYLYRPYENLVQAALRLVAWRYRQKDVNNFDKTVSFETGVVIVPSAVPADIKALLPALRLTL